MVGSIFLGTPKSIKTKGFLPRALITSSISPLPTTGVWLLVEAIITSAFKIAFLTALKGFEINVSDPNSIDR